MFNAFGRNILASPPCRIISLTIDELIGVCSGMVRRKTDSILGSIFLSIMLVLAFVIPSIANAQYYNGACNYHSYQGCSGNNLYWYDSCGNQQDLSQYCANGCYNNLCYNNGYNNYNYNNYNNCTYHAYKLCVGNNVYWYDSCGTQQDFYTSCVNNQTCQYGQCTSYIAPVINNYTAYSTKACYNNSIYWYDSLGVVSGLYQSCQDSNSCTLDACSANKCSNITKCDGTTCAVGSTDYNAYCTTTPITEQKCGNGLCEANLGETATNCSNDCKTANINSLSVSLFTKQDQNSSQWQKTVQTKSDSQVYFMISVVNNSATQIDNVNVSVNIPTEISSLGNLKLDGVQLSGDIVSGINIGSIASAGGKSITFEGKTQTISATETKTAIAKANITGNPSDYAQSDSASIEFSSTNQAPDSAAAISSAPSTSGFWPFLKRWSLWIIGALVLIFLFTVVFKRLSSDT